MFKCIEKFINYFKPDTSEERRQNGYYFAQKAYEGGIYTKEELEMLAYDLFDKDPFDVGIEDFLRETGYNT